MVKWGNVRDEITSIPYRHFVVAYGERREGCPTCWSSNEGGDECWALSACILRAADGVAFYVVTEAVKVWTPERKFVARSMGFGPSVSQAVP
jgi:hypothetical protein